MREKKQPPSCVLCAHCVRVFSTTAEYSYRCKHPEARHGTPFREGRGLAGIGQPPNWCPIIQVAEPPRLIKHLPVSRDLRRSLDLSEIIANKLMGEA